MAVQRLQPPPFGDPFLGRDGKPTPRWRDWLLKATSQIDVGAAPADATFLVTRDNPYLTAAVNLGLLSSGHLSIVVALGIATVSSSATIPAGDVLGILTVPQGGTGRASLTDGAVVIGNGAALVTLVGPGAAGTVLKGTGGDPSFGAVDLAADVSGVLPLANGGSGADLSATGGTHQVVKQSTAAGVFTVGRLDGADIAAGVKTIDDTDSPYTVLATDAVLLVDAAGGTVDVLLSHQPQAITVKKIDVSANVVTVDGDGDDIDGAPDVTLAAQWESVTVVTDGTDYFITAQVP